MTNFRELLLTLFVLECLEIRFIYLKRKVKKGINLKQIEEQLLACALALLPLTDALRYHCSGYGTWRTILSLNGYYDYLIEGLLVS